jgi:hypothetical protein
MAHALHAVSQLGRGCGGGIHRRAWGIGKERRF